MDELTYVDEVGSEVKTAQFLRNRGSCCKTCCRHCPYGHTLRQRGLQFIDYALEWRDLAESFTADRVQSSLADSLLSEGLGRRSPVFSLADHPPESLKLVVLKGRKIGLMVVSKLQVKELFLDRRYRNQGIDVPMVESFYF